MGRVASGQERVDRIEKKQKNGSIYIYERRSRYDSSKGFYVSVGQKLIGKKLPGSDQIVQTRSKRPNGTKQNEAKAERRQTAELVTRYTPVDLDQRAHTLKTAVHSLLYAGLSDQKIKDYLKETYDVTNDEYAQNLLNYIKEHPDPKDWY